MALRPTTALPQRMVYPLRQRSPRQRRNARFSHPLSVSRHPIMSRHDYDDDSRIIIERHHSAGVGPFLLGIALGAGIALLFAPRSGASTRRGIKRRALRVRRAAEDEANEVTDTVVGTFQDARRKVEDQIDSVRLAVDLKKQQVHRAMDAG